MANMQKVKQRIVHNHSEDEKDMEEGKHSASVFMPNLPRSLIPEEKKYLLAVERGDISTVRKMLQKSHRHPGYMNKDCVDPLGRGALHMSIDNENLEMVELLVVMGVETRDSLLHAINAEFVEAVEVLLEHEEIVHKEGEKYSWEKVDRQIASFTPEITPLILAAHKDNYEILKILLDRGAILPMPHDIRCGCEECLKSSSEDSLRHSMSRINSYKALASPSLIALSSMDPILTAFELSWELKNLAYDEQEFRTQYMDLRRQCRDFAEELLSHTRSSTELAVILNYDPDAPPYEDGEHMKLRRLELAIDYKQKKFVSHANVQQLLAAIWYEGLPGFRRKGFSAKLAEIAKILVLFPFFCLQYMIMPESKTSKLMRTPFMKFMIHSASYLFFLLLLILVSVRFEDLVIHIFGTTKMKLWLEEVSRKQRGNLPTPTECFVALYVIGFMFEEIREMIREGIVKYSKDMWNILDVLRDSLYLMTMILRVYAFVQQGLEIKKDPQTAYIPREEWDAFDPQLVSEGLFAAANVFSALKLIHIFSINPYLGPLQISLGRMVIDIVKFFFIYTLVLFAFACGLTQLLWYFNDLEKQKCYSLPGGLPNWSKQGDACMKWRRFHNLFEASQSLFWAGFGMVGLSDFELTGIQDYTRFWSMLMFGAYSVINIIVLLNLLIAMMSNSYSFIVEHADSEWKFARTKLWLSYFEDGKTLPPPFNIFPNVKLFRKLFGKPKSSLVRQLSSRSESVKRKTRDYRYLGVMRALLWRYVCSLQRRQEESPVTEDDINEVKGDISSLRYELVDLFGNNGMDVSSCAKKSKAALGRKMRIWERRLMRDFHVSPAMGSENSPAPIEESSNSNMSNLSAADRFRRIARLAINAANTSELKNASQIGRTISHDDECRENLKKAMDRARRKMEESTPDGSPGSSRGCSPYPDIYLGPNLLDTINNLDLSPCHSMVNTPHATSKPNKKDDKAVDLSKLTIPGRRQEKSLKKSYNDENPENISSKALKMFNKTKAQEVNNDPITIATVSELRMNPTLKQDEQQSLTKLAKSEMVDKKYPKIQLPLHPQHLNFDNTDNVKSFDCKSVKFEPSLQKPVREIDVLQSNKSDGKISNVVNQPNLISEVSKRNARQNVLLDKNRQYNQPQDQAELQNTDVVRKPSLIMRQASADVLRELSSTNQPPFIAVTCPTPVPPDDKLNEQTITKKEPYNKLDKNDTLVDSSQKNDKRWL